MASLERLTGDLLTGGRHVSMCKRALESDERHTGMIKHVHEIKGLINQTGAIFTAVPLATTISMDLPSPEISE